MIFTKTKES